MMRSAVRIALLCFAVSTTAWGQADLPTVADEVITVHGRRDQVAEEEAPTAFVTTIDPEPHAEQLETVGDALAESVGVQVRRFGGLGAFSTVSIRGSSPNQVQIYFDGIPLSRARNEVVNLSDLPLDSLDRIDIYRGTVPLSFGVAGIGGVVNLVPKTPSDIPESEASVAYGSFNTRKAVAFHSRRVGTTNLLAHATYMGSEGDFTFFVPNDVEHAGGSHQKRINNSFNSVSALIKGQQQVSSTATLDLTSEFFFKDQGEPGRAVPQLAHPSFSELRSTTYARLLQEGLVDDQVDVTTTVFGTFLNEQFKDPQGEFGAGRADRDDITTLIGGNLNATWRAPLNNEVRWFGEATGERFAGYNAARRPELREDPEQKRVRFAIGLQDQIRLWQDRIAVVPTVRYEHLDDQGTEFNNAGQPTRAFANSEDLWTPGIGAQLTLLPGLDLRGNLNRLNRAPSLTERFGNRGSIAGNPRLDSETGITRDIGFRFESHAAWLLALELEYAYFNNDVDDIIVLLAVAGPNQVRPTNVDAARIRGHELSLKLTPFEWVNFDCNYTHQDSENRTQDPAVVGKQLPLRPQDEVYSRLQFSGERWRTYYEVNFVGSNFLTSDNFERYRVGSRLIHTVGARVNVLDWLSLGFDARNLGNDRAEDVAAYPLPGRSYFGTIKATFG